MVGPEHADYLPHAEADLARRCRLHILHTLHGAWWGGVGREDTGDYPCWRSLRRSVQSTDGHTNASASVLWSFGPLVAGISPQRCAEPRSSRRGS